MCGIAGIVGPGASRARAAAMAAHLHHRGPDARWVWDDDRAGVALGYDRLAIVDLSEAADEPLCSPTGRRAAFNGEVYNHPELRAELAGYPFRTVTDTEVLLAAFERWGPGCLERLLGMFAVLLWEPATSTLVAARDRFGVKPLYYHLADDGTLTAASEIGALFAAGVPAVVDETAWATYLTDGRSDAGAGTFWQGVRRLPAGHELRWTAGRVEVRRWYDVVARVGDEDDDRPVDRVLDEYRGLLDDSVRLRFRADVPVGINLSGGVDSSTLLALVGRHRADSLTAYTFVTGDPAYDETPWVEAMLARTPHRARSVLLTPVEVPDLAASVQAVQDEPFGGIPTLAYARLFDAAKRDGTTVVLDGQGMDEQWAGYDYYRGAVEGVSPSAAPVVQGARARATRPDCLVAEFARLADGPVPPAPFLDPVRQLQHRDLLQTKLPRALRYNDRVSMRASTELREPFLDHRLVELALRQPADRKWRGTEGKWLLRRLAAELVPAGLATAPKRPVQTPQREWLRGPLRPWAEGCIDDALDAVGRSWLDPDRTRAAWSDFAAGRGDNGYFAWQWVNLGLAVRQRPAAFGARP